MKDENSDVPIPAPSRREALLQAGALAKYVAPAMILVIDAQLIPTS